ncbi:hypothetical protein [Halobellus sp. H-GB7]|uniref:hypothetical protein n=1 Tax=Halobellus sp. H-GB7 TaxID=3069756 RepID=UPI0027ADF180|nr:hypothetical protein [Halobellus sp. H-GB7]MDQ2053194.1 hypothetical protein [Halobellus sp. H-GB7]
MSDADTRVWVAVDSGTDVYHYVDDCAGLQSGGPAGECADATPTTIGDVPDRFRPCERCRYFDIPALEDAPARRDRAQTETAPWIVALGAALGLAMLFVAIYGGAL